MPKLPVFAHPQTAHLRAALDGSPTAQRWLRRIDAHPVELVTSGPIVDDMRRVRGLAALDHHAGRMYASPDLLGADRPRGFTDAFVASGLLHEGIHAVQFGTRSRVEVALSPIRDVVTGLRNLASGRYGGEGLGRFRVGMAASILRHEREAFRVQARVLFELGERGPRQLRLVRDGQPVRDPEIMEHLLRAPAYRAYVTRKQAIDAAALGGAVATGVAGRELVTE